MYIPCTLHSSSPDDTERIGASLARLILADTDIPRFVALYGDLGVGKTAFVRGFTSEISPTSRVKSPTFALVNEYRGDITSVFHFDMYRIESEDELYSIGFYDYLDRRGICLVEWSENIEDSLPDSLVRIEIVKDSAHDTDSRSITITKIG